MGPLDVECPWCKVPPLVDCIWNGRLRTDPHRSRLRVADGLPAFAIRTRWPDILGANLREAGALCEAFRLGGDHRLAWYERTVGYGLPNDKWHPGCGRPAKKGG